MNKVCTICKTEFKAKLSKQFLCSSSCREIYKLEKYNSEFTQRECIFCKVIFFRHKNKLGNFCSRSCGSKHHIAIGTFDNWKNRKNERQGFVHPCNICGKKLYLQPRFKEKQNLVKVCSEECERKHFSIMFSGSGNPSFGTKATIEHKEKQKLTLQEKYGVSNAYALAKIRTVSKPQKEIYAWLNENGVIAKIEQTVKNNKTYKHVDIQIVSKNIIIEYNGDYWHCNPRKYCKDYFHKKKNKLAKEIWKDDTSRINFINSLGYKVYVIWEMDYMADKIGILKQMKEFINEQET